MADCDTINHAPCFIWLLQWQAEAEEKERRRKEKMEAHLYTVLKVARDSDLRQQIGNNQFFDLVDHDKVGKSIMYTLR